MCFLDCDKWCFIGCCIDDANYIGSSTIFSKKKKRKEKRIKNKHKC
uniref:Uncharacterized protein n=1 Tax=Anguilla anguilla TaxID=7936 RepID=A0A0E9VUR6_ANGAN